MGSVQLEERVHAERQYADFYTGSERILGTIAMSGTTLEQPHDTDEHPAILDVANLALRIAKDQLAPDYEHIPDIEYISIKDLEAEYRADHDPQVEAAKCGIFKLNRSDKIKDLTGYNLTQPMPDKRYNPETGEPYFVIGVRMEEFDDEDNSKTEFFQAADPFSKEWDHIDDETLPQIHGQDPSVARIGNQLLLGVVETQRVPVVDTNDTELTWHMAFYTGSSIHDLSFFAYGPEKMKDICEVELQDKRITHFTRPQASNNPDPEKGGLGQIGEITTDTLDAIKDPSVLENAPLINTRFKDWEEWGGVGQAIALQDDKIGLIFHGARRDYDHPDFINESDKPRIYHTLSGIYNPDTRKIENIKIEAIAEEFEGFGYTPKKKTLQNVAFGKGITDPNADGDVLLAIGVGDVVAGYKIIKDPFAGMRLSSGKES